MNYNEFVKGLCKSGTDIAKEFIENPSKAHLTHMAVGVCGEAGELADALKRHTIYGKEIDRENVVEELGDLRFYMQGIMADLGITEDEVVKGNIAKLSKRYSKGSYSDQQAQSREDKE